MFDMEEKVQSENLITHEDFLSVSRRVRYNQYIAEYYERFAEENEMPIGLTPEGEVKYGADPNFKRIAKRMKECSRKWTFDFYKAAKYKNLVRVDRCMDRFCLNCQALKADQRLAQYSSILDSYVGTNDLYHAVFTVPNVSAERLADTVRLMLDRFSYLVRFLDGRKRIRNVDFEQYGFIGGARALEITVSKKDGTYHPHLHTILILKKDLPMDQVYWNRFSEDRSGRNPTRLFSEFDMLLQRIWCLLMLRIKVTKENIEHIADLCDYPDGFSCRADLSNGKYSEIFKYALKGSYKTETLFTYEAFLTLYKAMFNVRAYETYGCLKKWDFNDVDESLGLNSPDEAFDLFLARLQRAEHPERIDEILATVLKFTLDEKYKYVSKATFTRHFKALSEEDKIEAMKKLDEIIVQERIEL